MAKMTQMDSRPLMTQMAQNLRTREPENPRTSSAQDPRPEVGPLTASDLAAVIRLDARLTGRRKAAYWKARFDEFVAPGHVPGRVGLAARVGGRLCGYLLGEVRAFEFGSPTCGWIFAVGVDPDEAHHGLGSALVAEAGRQFRRAGVSTVRTMVGRTDVAMLAFFRSNGFVGGSFTQLELDLEPRARRT
jgi:ribosomal protein S18 acetylase RimI-like enzyme